jgi:hypothetical protein
MPSESTTILLLGLLISGPFVTVAWRSAERLGPASIIVRSLILYVCGAQLLKGMLLTMFDWQPAIDAGFVPRLLTQNEAITTAQLIIGYSVSMLAAGISAIWLQDKIGQFFGAPNSTNEGAGVIPEQVLRIRLICMIVILPYK